MRTTYNMLKMKHLSLGILSTCLTLSLFAQEIKPPRLVKTVIGDSGCSAYLPAGMPEFEHSKSEDDADVYTSEMELDNFVFGCIAVKFTAPFTDSGSDDLEDLLIAYMDYLQGAFEITSAAGYGRGHTLDAYPNARGVLDYWEDGEKNQFAVMGWIDQSHLGFLYIGGAKEYPLFNVQEMYLKGWRFE